MMLRKILIVLALIAAATATGPAGAQVGATMPNFESDAELLRLLGKPRFRPPRLAPVAPAPAPAVTTSPPVVMPGPAYGYSDSDTQVEQVVVTGARIPDAPPSITNNQVVGVDEGGIVKVSGDYLIILRRGRLFTVSTANGDLRPTDALNAYPPGVDASQDWYDEMLVKGDLIVVIGYSYGRGGTEISRFRIGPDGRLSFIDAHHLRSADYYSDRNYASRLIGDELIVYAPLNIYDAGSPLEALPGLSRWQAGQKAPVFKRLVRARQIFAPAPIMAGRGEGIDIFHTVTRCDLTAAELDCNATVVLGPEESSFYVASDAVYVWTGPNSWDDDADRKPRFIYRLPLDGARPSAVQVRGGPVDQFSFNRNLRQGRLEVLMSPEGDGERMWSGGYATGQPALLRLPMWRFGDGSEPPLRADYRPLPGDDGSRINRNRFIGDYVLYALEGNEDGQNRRLVVVPVSGADPTLLTLDFDVGRLEQLGGDALAAGGYDKAYFVTIALDAPGPRIGDRFVLPGLSGSDARSHAFFFRPDPGSDGADGLLGLPMADVLTEPPYRAQVEMLFLRRADRRLSNFGRLSSTPRTDDDPYDDLEPDGCVASCVDWYGDARPIFLRGRVFALMGYELVEGDASGERIREVRRIDFAPKPAAR